MADRGAELDDEEGAHEHADDDGLLDGVPSGKKPPVEELAIVGGSRCRLAVQVLLLLGVMLGAFALGRPSPPWMAGDLTLQEPQRIPVASTVAREPPARAPAAGAAAPAALGAIAAPSPASSAAATAGTAGAMAPGAVAAPPPASSAAATAASAAPQASPASAAAASAPEAASLGPPRLRLVVNSHVLYSAPLDDLLRSLERAHFGSHFRDVVIVFGGSRAEIGPRTALGKWGELGVTHINVTLNAFDYNGLSALFHYKDHPRVQAHAYLYVHDTVLMTEDFMECFGKLASIIQRDELQIPATPSSNIFALGHGLVERYGKNFDRNFTKGEAVDLEWKKANILQFVKHITSFAGRVTTLPLRRFKGLADPYNTGVKRHKYSYPYFCLDKFVLIGKHGDIGGNGKLRNNYP